MGRQNLKRKGIAIGMTLALMACLLSGCGAARKERFQASYLSLFDTVTTILGYEENEAEFAKTAQRIHDEMEEYDHLYDIYQEYPDLVNLCTINRHPGETFTVDQRIIDLLQLCAEADAFSGHRTDAMMGAVLRLWHEAREEGINNPEEAYLPDRAALEAAAAHTGFDRLEGDPEARTVRLTDPEASLDVGALAKGFAVQRVCETLPEGYLLSVGGNVAATGPKPDGAGWIVGVQDPDAPGEAYLHKLLVSKGAVVTSGDYQRRYTVDGVAYHHIIDPETLFPGTKWRAVTVVAADSGLADALSTTLFLMTREEGQALLTRYGAEAMWIAPDGSQLYSPGYEAYLQK